MSWIDGKAKPKSEERDNDMTEMLSRIRIKMDAGLDEVQTLTIAEVAAVLSVSESMAYKLTDPEVGDLPARKVAGSRRVRVSDMKKYLSTVQ